MANHETSPATASTHTPGPWLLQKVDSATADWLVELEDGSRIAVVGCGAQEGDPDGAAANARLIATSPELLEALETIDEWSQSHGEEFPYWVVDAVIAKARGKAA